MGQRKGETRKPSARESSTPVQEMIVLITYCEHRLIYCCY